MLGRNTLLASNALAKLVAELGETMGLKNWLLGLTSVTAQTNPETTDTSKSKTISLEELYVNGDYLFLAKGTSFRQDAIHKLGKGEHYFALQPEPDNPHDSRAVAVFGVLPNDEAVLVGYLPKGSSPQADAFELSMLLYDKGKTICLAGDVQDGNSGLIVRIGMPSGERISDLMAEYS